MHSQLIDDNDDSKPFSNPNPNQKRTSKRRGNKSTRSEQKGEEAKEASRPDDGMMLRGKTTIRSTSPGRMPPISSGKAKEIEFRVLDCPHIDLSPTENLWCQLILA